MDDLDRRILRALISNARSSGAALASATGVAESTVSLRLKRLQSEKVIQGTHVDLDLMALGMTVQALISVRLVSIVREDVENFRREAPGWPGVIDLYHMAGADDFLLHVAARNSIELRDFVLEHLASHPAVANTETNLIFEHAPGRGLERLLG
ncbi:MAG: Lrp/AsnC family transcriptional regulator [Cryobacterium sp.]|nr:Lrp/AsnC family transcriptional regulator [Cryobacterium sp.]MBX3089439.1 Lrp/AsnC family transcriptional regulator [Cryobacterium sp.]MCO5294703.1 Lrp/AsnC family transcriptional regulator [Homoserinimonas sp.]MCW5944254.1 Lrp/AsnC family transcriptional regulator [Cryobacterium sp.]